MTRRNRRGGYVMVLFAMMICGIMAMAALVIDIGFARLAQRQMQSAADSAAIEGLRFRDTLPPMAQTQDLEMERRVRASQQVSQVFDDNLLADSSDPFNYGAGPIIRFDDRGDDGVYANEFIYSEDNPSTNDPEIGSLPKVPVYKPKLAINLADDSRGDMVAGNFDSVNVNPKFDNTKTSRGHNEYRDPGTDEYIRRNFTIPPVGDPANAFLVRIRRTDETFSPDDAVGTSGETLPYLFGRGALMFDKDTPDDPRHLIRDGIKVRATAIADSRPVVRVWPELPSFGILGAVPVAYERSDWEGTRADPLKLVSPVTTIGELVATNGAGDPNVNGYAIIFESVSEQDRTIGFGWIGPDAPSPNADGTVAIQNASSRLSDAWSVLKDLSEFDRDRVRSLNKSLRFALQSPVLVR